MISTSSHFLVRHSFVLLVIVYTALLSSEPALAGPRLAALGRDAVTGEFDLYEIDSNAHSVSSFYTFPSGTVVEEAFFRRNPDNALFLITKMLPSGVRKAIQFDRTGAIAVETPLGPLSEVQDASFYGLEAVFSGFALTMRALNGTNELVVIDLYGGQVFPTGARFPEAGNLSEVAFGPSFGGFYTSGITGRDNFGNPIFSYRGYSSQLNGIWDITLNYSSGFHLFSYTSFPGGLFAILYIEQPNGAYSYHPVLVTSGNQFYIDPTPLPLNFPSSYILSHGSIENGVHRFIVSDELALNTPSFLCSINLNQGFNLQCNTLPSNMDNILVYRVVHW